MVRNALGTRTLKPDYKCYRCKEVKPNSAFSPNASCNPRPVKGYCKECSVKYREEDPLHLDKERAGRIRRETRDPGYQYRKTRLWKRDNPERNREQNNRTRSKRDAIIRGANKVDPIGLADVYDRDKGICQLCGNTCCYEDASIDHKLALSKGGQHVWVNVQLAHKKCNSQKGNR